ERFCYENVETVLIGDYQVQNTATVLCAVDLLQQQGFAITEESLRRGLQNTHWPGRMERRDFEGEPVLLDGAHNPNGAQMLADYLENHYAPGSCNLVLSALAKKDVSGIVAPLRGCAAIGNVYFTCIHGEDQMDYLVELWQEGIKEKGTIRCIASPKEALQAAVHEPGAELTVCAGSLYLVGEMETIIDEQE
ncbi:MAG: hypothetical protein IKU17_00885, partial [Clostridia bacterium]|nr:hypothetical protein [Clostridia bacterium]